MGVIDQIPFPVQKNSAKALSVKYEVTLYNCSALVTLCFFDAQVGR